MIKIGLKQEKLPQLNFGIKFFESVVVVFFGFFFPPSVWSFNFEDWDLSLIKSWLYFKF